MEKKEQILDLYFNKHMKQKEIVDITNVSKQYISKTIKEEKDMSKKRFLKVL